MFGFAAPAWLAALAALAVPIALHLWSQRPRQVVPIGSLRHLRGPEGPRAWGRRLEDLPLLSLRLSILLVVCLALAGLWWRGKAPRLGAAGTIILADPALVNDSLAFFGDPVVDSLRRAGTPIHLLLPGLPRLGSGPFGPMSPVGGLWSRLLEADHAAPAGPDFLVLASPSAGQLGATRPDLSRPVRWRNIEPVEGKPRVVAQWPAGPDTTIRLLSWRSGMASFRYLDSSATSGATTRAAEGTADSSTGFWGKLNVRSVSSFHLEVVADQRDTPNISATVAAFSAAIEAATGAAVLSRVMHSDSAQVGTFQPDIIVWLSGQSVSDVVRDMVGQGVTLVEFAAQSNGGAEPLAYASAAGAGFPPVRTMVRLGGGPAGAPILGDQYGRVMVSVTQSGSGRHYRIATRLDPAWSDLALGPALPELAYWIVTGQSDPVASAPVSAAQATPTAVGLGSPGGRAPHSLTRALLLLAGLLLLAERIVIHALRRTVQA